MPTATLVFLCLLLCPRLRVLWSHSNDWNNWISIYLLMLLQWNKHMCVSIFCMLNYGKCSTICSGSVWNPLKMTMLKQQDQVRSLNFLQRRNWEPRVQLSCYKSRHDFANMNSSRKTYLIAPHHNLHLMSQDLAVCILHILHVLPANVVNTIKLVW